MPMFATISEKLRAQPTWQKLDVFIRLRPHCLTEIEQDEEHCLEAMQHGMTPSRSCERSDAVVIRWWTTIRRPVDGRR